MKNSFKANIEANKRNVEIVEASKVAKDIKQYGGLDVYNLMKQGNMYAIVVDGTVVGGATSKKDAEAAIEFLTHFTGGQPLTSANVMSAGMKSITALTKANNIVEAEADGTIKVSKTFKLNDVEYIVDDTNELYTIDGELIGNIADIVEAKEKGALTQELYDEILNKRIAEYWNKSTCAPATSTESSTTTYAASDCTGDGTIELHSVEVTYDDLGCDRDDRDDTVENYINDWIYDNYNVNDIEDLEWYRAGDHVVIDATCYN